MSKIDTLNKWISAVQMAAPLLGLLPGGEKVAPFVPTIISGIIEAEQIPGATNDQKKAHVENLAMAAFQSLQQTGKIHLGDAGSFQQAVGLSVDTGVAIANQVKQAHQAALPAGVLVPPTQPPA